MTREIWVIEKMNDGKLVPLRDHVYAHEGDAQVVSGWRNKTEPNTYYPKRYVSEDEK